MSIIQKVEDYMCIPKDVISNAPILKMYGGYELYISNYKGLLEYQSCILLIQCYHCRVKITGDQLWIRSYDQYEMNIKGKIDTVSFL